MALMTLGLDLSLPAALRADLEALLARADRERWAARLWQRDATLWTGGDESRWLAWLTVAETERPRIAELRHFAEQARGDGFTHTVLLGMGGSSLGPEVLDTVFGATPSRFQVLDSTDPAQVAAAAQASPPERTLVVVASKSGTTLEPHVFLEYFWDRSRDGHRFAAITDPGSQLEAQARERGFRAIFHGDPEIGGRYSALSRFGLVPAALLGVNLEALLDGAIAMAATCGPRVAAADNPGLVLGALLGCAATNGRNKLTISTSPALWDFGAWLEQLIAESTGKNGKAIVPVDGERLGPPEIYGSDRFFAAITLAGDEDSERSAALRAIATGGHPVVELTVGRREDLGAEFLRWEIATAFAGAVLGIHPFDQPDVEASKLETRKLTDAFESSGSLPAETPFFEGDGFRFFADPGNQRALASATSATSATDILRGHFARLRPGDYAGLLAYLEMRAEHRAALQAMRHQLRERFRVATCVGFGPRFLHSTGQAYKGGTDQGVFLQITGDDAADLPIPGRQATFGVVKAAQARGDFEVLAERGRRALRVHLGKDTTGDLRRLQDTIARALAR
jgi:transaldolase/glucose-6-phosphate isomerase